MKKMERIHKAGVLDAYARARLWQQQRTRPGYLQTRFWIQSRRKAAEIGGGSLKMKFRQLLAGALIFALCGVPETIRAQQSAPSGAAARPDAQQTQPPAGQTQRSPQQPQPTGPVNGVTVDPSRGPLQPATSASQPQANEPSTQTNAGQPPQQNAQPQAQSVPESPAPQTPGEPVGAATAPAGRTAGGAASNPAGTAIAPAKQRQVRSWLIRVGAIAAAGAAIGTVYALSRKTPSTPPGAQTLGTH